MRFNHALWPVCAWRGMMTPLKMWFWEQASFTGTTFVGQRPVA